MNNSVDLRPFLSVIIPANNEAGYIANCLRAVLASDALPEPVEIIVVSNNSTDATVSIASGFAQDADSRGWVLKVLDLPQGGKTNALNAGDGAASAQNRIYLDADVVVSPPLLAQIAAILARDAVVFASGKVVIAEAETAISRAYGRIYRKVPFMTSGVPGCGLFAVNAAGRARWALFPDIISDDTFVRLSFTPAERVSATAGYEWPIVEGFSNLIRVRRRQDVGVEEIAQRFPTLVQNDDKRRFGYGRLVRLALADPVGFAVYFAVTVIVRLTRSGGSGDWSRGR